MKSKRQTLDMRWRQTTVIEVLWAAWPLTQATVCCGQERGWYISRYGFARGMEKYDSEGQRPVRAAVAYLRVTSETSISCGTAHVESLGAAGMEKKRPQTKQQQKLAMSSQAKAKDQWEGLVGKGTCSSTWEARNCTTWEKINESSPSSIHWWSLNHSENLERVTS